MEHFLTTWGYLALFLATFVSSMAIPVGADIAIGYAGALASGQLTTEHHMDLAVVILVVTLGEVVGSLAGYAIGRLGGRPLVDRAGRYVLLTHRDLDRAEAWFARRGEAFVLFGRLIPLLRSFVSLAAGLGEMALGKFVAFTVIGCAIWASALAGIGYSLGSSWHHVLKDFSYAGYVVAVLIVLAVATIIGHRIRGVRHERAEQLRPAAPAVVAPADVVLPPVVPVAVVAARLREDAAAMARSWSSTASVHDDPAQINREVVVGPGAIVAAVNGASNSAG
jgi:membrane protein DedA with SNARE-associated domain